MRLMLEAWLAEHKAQLNAKAPERYHGNKSAILGRKPTKSQERVLSMGRRLLAVNQGRHY